MKKKWISALVCMAMVLSLLPVSAFAEDDEAAATSVKMGYSTTLEDDGIYVPAEGDVQNGPPANIRVADKFVPTEETKNPEGGYIKYNNGTITVYGNVTFTTTASEPIYINSGTLTITGDEDASLTLKCTSGGSPIQIGSANTSANLVLAGGVNFTAIHESTVPAIGSYSKNNFETAENYSGDIYLSSKSMAINGGNVNLKTSGSISLSTSIPTTSTSPFVTAENISLEGNSVVIEAPNASPMISVGNDISITTTEGNLTIASDSTAAPTISSTGTVSLSAPKGDVTISNSATESGYFAQAISAQNVVVKDTENFIVDGGYSYAISANGGSFTATNCHSINIENKAGNGAGAIYGNVNITGDGSENGQAVFKSKGTVPCINGDVTIKKFNSVDIYSEQNLAISSTGDDGIDIEDCGLVQIGNINSQTPAVSANNDIQFKNCETVEVSSQEFMALESTYGNISFVNCDKVSAESESTNSSAISTYDEDKATTFTGCKSVSVKTGGTSQYGPSAISGNYTCDGKIIITEKGTTKIIENGKDPITTGGDVTKTGLSLNSSNMPTTETTYVAGNGTIIFTPATETANAKLVLNNAEIKRSEADNGTGIFFNDDADDADIDIEINGTNTICGYYGIYSKGVISISGNGTLDIDAQINALASEKRVEVNSGTLVLSGESGIYGENNITINGGNISITPSGRGDGLHTSQGDIIVNNGTLKINSESENVYGIYAVNNDGETPGNIYIHGGTLNIDVGGDAIDSTGNIVIDNNAKVTATGGEDGIYASTGNITINGNAKVIVAGGESGIDAAGGNIIIDESAEVTATGYYNGIYADEDENENTEEGIAGGSIIISGHARVTARGNDSAAIYACKALKISDNAVVKADGAEGEVDIEADECTVSDSANLTAWVQTGNNYIAYGICDNNNFEQTIRIDNENNTLEVKPDSVFTVNAGTLVSVVISDSSDSSDNSVLKINGRLINEGMLGIEVSNTENLPNGKIVNNSLLTLDFGDASVDAGAVIREMGLTGTGFVSVLTGEQSADYYTNDGKKIEQKTVPSLSDETGDCGDLEKDGYHWNSENKTLTLRDVLVQGITGSLTDDITIQTKGDVLIAAIQNNANGNITVTGDSSTIMMILNSGDIIFKDTTANVYNIGGAQSKDGDIEYNNSVTLINSKVTVGGPEGSMICTKNLTMDDTSVLTLKYAEIQCDAENGLEGIKAYLPKDGGYKIGQDEDEEFYTILDANNKIVRDIVLKKAETTKPGGSSGGGGSSAESYGITIKSAENGKVEASKKSASKDAAITLTVTADEGYQLDKLTVLDSKNNAIALTDQKDGKFEFKMPDGSVTVEATFVKKAAEEEKPVSKAFADVPADAWFKKAVDYVNGKGLMSGVDEDTFGPELLTNRAMLVTILWRMEGCPTSEQATDFKDIKETDYFYNAVLWAAENKIVSGVSETSFAPSDSITREQLAAILYRYAAYKGYDVTQGGMAVREFSDYESISGYARSSVAWTVNAGIVSGKGNNTLDPGGVATRAEVASMLMRFCENIAK